MDDAARPLAGGGAYSKIGHNDRVAKGLRPSACAERARAERTPKPEAASLRIFCAVRGMGSELPLNLERHLDSVLLPLPVFIIALCPVATAAFALVAVDLLPAGALVAHGLLVAAA